MVVLVCLYQNIKETKKLNGIIAEFLVKKRLGRTRVSKFSDCWYCEVFVSLKLLLKLSYFVLHSTQLSSSLNNLKDT